MVFFHPERQGRCQLQIRWLKKYSAAAERALNELWRVDGRNSSGAGPIFASRAAGWRRGLR
ncbi:hypothetical protein DXM27_11140 [Rhizobium rhizogenes]|uniref:Uncharacterized protein n=1 Tax=Rhizobium rhizogenes TaxID=359 RepID=A0AA88F0U9_RHIRH|nr:hypothetical protein DXM27_11140 [Rhizobium rhizogenes]